MRDGKKLTWDEGFTNLAYLRKDTTTSTLDYEVATGYKHKFSVNAIQQMSIDASGVILGSATNNNYLYLDSTKSASIRGNNFSGVSAGIEIGYGSSNSVGFNGGTAGALSETINSSGLTLYRDNGGLIMGLTNSATTCRVKQTTATTSLDRKRSCRERVY